MTTAQMYWLVILDNFGGLFATVIVLLVAWIVISGVRCIHAAIEDEEPPSHALNHIFRGLVAIGVVGVITAFVPSTKQMAAIIIVPKIVNNEAVQSVGNELYTLAVEWMQELRPEKQKSECK